MSAPSSKLSHALAQVVGETPGYRFYFLSELLKRPLATEAEGRRLGRVKDLVVKVATPYPQVVGVLIDHGWGKPHEFLPWDRVIRITPPAIVVALREDDPPYRSFVDQPGWILLNEHLMRQTILDIDGRRTKVVNDVHLLESKGRMLLVHVDISFKGVLRRLGLGRLRWVQEKLLSWRIFRPLTVEDMSTDTVMLSVSRKQTKYLPGDDLAAALAELKRQEPAEAADAGDQTGAAVAPDGFALSTDFVAVRGDSPAEEVMKQLRASAHRPDGVSVIYVVASDHTLRGVVDLSALVLAAGDARLETLMTPAAAAVGPNQTRAQIAEAFGRSQFRILPVIDAQGRLLGVVTRADFAR